MELCLQNETFPYSTLNNVLRMLTSWYDFKMCYSPNSQHSGGCCYKRYNSKMHVKVKTCEILFAHYLLLSCLKLFGNFAQNMAVSMLCSMQIFKTNLTTEVDVMDERDFTRIKFHFRLIPYMATASWWPSIACQDSLTSSLGSCHLSQQEG